MDAPAATVRAERDSELVARVVARRPLLYDRGPDLVEDRPAHVRSGSGLARFGRRFAVVQDDANFVALFDPGTLRVEALPLPGAPGGARQFDDARGNKADKLDLESCIVIVLDGAETLVAFGSGSTSARERVAVIPKPGRGHEPRVVAVPALYGALRSRRDFSGSELNIEGALAIDGSVRFFQRGNGRPKDGHVPVNATCDVELSDVVRLVSGANATPVIRRVVRYELGDIDGVPLTFTDAAVSSDGVVVYLASAEDSPDAVRDGPVVGTAFGVIEGNRARFALMHATGGTPFLDKAEGVLLSTSDRRLAHVVIDADDPSRPAELCDVQLDGPWW